LHLQRKEGIIIIQILKNNALFADIKEQDITSMLQCLGCRRRSIEKGDFIFLAGETQPALGILLSGNAQIIKENFEGVSMIVGSLKAGDLFGETYACMGLKVLPVSVRALGKCEVLLMDVTKIIGTCQSACVFHRQLISNLLRIIAEKNIFLSQKMSFLSHKTIRSRLEAYFSSRIQQTGSYDFSIPFNLTELADYLCIDRSAMSRELSHMKSEGILDYRGRSFHWRRKSV
jgi:cAMP-binding proteins - catabolite gene activator and regulatory subunit of cAMP-dependent protein kinases